MGTGKPLAIGSLEAVFRSVRLPVGLVIDELRIEGDDPECTFDPFRLHLDHPGKLQVTLGEAAVSRFLNEQAPGGLRDFIVTMKSGQIVVQATARVLIDIRATATCTLRIVEGKCIYVDLEALDSVGGSAARGLVEGQLAKINPIVDARHYPLDIVLTRIEISDGRVDVFGTVAPIEGPSPGP